MYLEPDRIHQLSSLIDYISASCNYLHMAYGCPRRGQQHTVHLLIQARAHTACPTSWRGRFWSMNLNWPFVCCKPQRLKVNSQGGGGEGEGETLPKGTEKTVAVTKHFMHKCTNETSGWIDTSCRLDLEHVKHVLISVPFGLRGLEWPRPALGSLQWIKSG